MPGKAKRIAITGASGVGKTTLAALLSETLKLPLIPEVARELCRIRGFDNPAQIPDQQEFRNEVLDYQLKLENGVAVDSLFSDRTIDETEKTGSEDFSFLSDRSTIDCWALWQRWQICSAMTYDTESYYERCRKQATSYTHIIYIPPMFPPEEDNFRWTEPDYIKQLDRLTRLTIYDWCLLDRTYTITTDNLKHRQSEVLTWLEA